MTNNNHEVIFAIVNAGFAEDVMDVAREPHSLQFFLGDSLKISRPFRAIVCILLPIRSVRLRTS